MKLAKFRRYVSEKHGLSSTAQWQDAVHSSLKYNISFDDYYLFRFYEKQNEEREKWAGTGYMYEYQKHMNPVSERSVLENKIEFCRVYEPFIRHRFESLEDLKREPGRTNKLLDNSSEKIVLKHSKGQCGRGIEVWDTADLTPETLIKNLEISGNDVAEEFVQQHSELTRMSPSGLNTVRVITQLDAEDNVQLLGARLRITVNSAVDNLAAGNIAAPIDLQTGKIDGPAVYSDITKKDVTRHPVTGTEIIKFQIPFWDDVLELAQKTALYHTGNRSIGWDIAVTENGPDLIEGNHDWCKLLWQLPVKLGLKSMLEPFRKEWEVKKK